MESALAQKFDLAVMIWSRSGTTTTAATSCPGSTSEPDTTAVARVQSPSDLVDRCQHPSVQVPKRRCDAGFSFNCGGLDGDRERAGADHAPRGCPDPGRAEFTP